LQPLVSGVMEPPVGVGSWIVCRWRCAELFRHLTLSRQHQYTRELFPHADCANVCRLPARIRQIVPSPDL